MNRQEKLTKKQHQILEYVTGYIRGNGYAPSYRDIGEALGLSSTATVHEHIKNLKEKGCLSSGNGEARALEVDPELSRIAVAVTLPLLGLITAGEPIEAVEGKETMDIPATLVRKPDDTFVLRVRGESMKDDGILSGDLVIVEKNPAPRDGDTVVALLDNEYATLKRFYREKGRVRLQPANSSMEPIYVKELAVQGVVRAVIRDFRSG
ncbi:repressor LexA [Candidatus Uhrbacteria bacterium RIFOXYC2_FULL_47_19]|uniref:LexA repressor n=1 Tax=Candidatus Uhrbacteria bacterium RIFOXYC2_FULL_47_19 TaxID=1802424 RepID=A0A1F7WDR8_9BACT|nr:MAG: repressor LexA [Candidatus Uhrbacteria bacterium RIFOXYC2_FULL_47_19]HCC22479.1 repressor LexA [Candidatus Uhrbacteria bacterium]